MRLLVVADLHYSLPQYDWVLGVAPDFDLVIIAGDHLDLSSIVDVRAQIVVFIQGQGSAWLDEVEVVEVPG